MWKFLKDDLLTVKIWKIIKETYELLNKPIPDIKELETLLNEKTFDIYKNKLTVSINQTDSLWASDLVSRYKPKSIEELSAFVAAIRPGFASLLNTFINRESYSNNVPELDKLLESSFHFLMYQENLMQYFVWLGIEESETYDIIKKIAKKKFKQKELDELENKLKQNWIKKIGTINNFKETWEVINNSAKYRI